MTATPAFSPFHLGGWQVAWDSTSLGWFKTCPQLYEYHMIKGLRPNGDSIHLEFGVFYHTALERYYITRAAGGDHTQGLRATVRYTLEATWINGAAWAPDHVKNRSTLLRSVIWYLEHFMNDPATTKILSNGKPAVELSFRFDVGEWMMAGHLDRVVEFAGEDYVLDHKTTQSTPGPYYFEGYSPHNQMSLYTIASQVAYSAPVAGVIVDVAQIAVGFTRFERGFASRSRPVLEEWMEDFHTWAELAKSYYLRGHFPKNDTACSNYGGCTFRKICRASPVMRDRFLASDFHVRRWNPLEAR